MPHSSAYVRHKRLSAAGAVRIEIRISGCAKAYPFADAVQTEKVYFIDSTLNDTILHSEIDIIGIDRFALCKQEGAL